MNGCRSDPMVLARELVLEQAEGLTVDRGEVEVGLGSRLHGAPRCTPTRGSATSLKMDEKLPNFLLALMLFRSVSSFCFAALSSSVTITGPVLS